jgi:hypothetical protein
VLIELLGIHVRGCNHGKRGFFERLCAEAGQKQRGEDEETE